MPVPRRHRAVIAALAMLLAAAGATGHVTPAHALSQVNGAGAGTYGETFGARGGPCGFFGATSYGAIVKPAKVTGTATSTATP